MEKNHFITCLCTIMLAGMTLWAGEPQEIKLSETIIYSSMDGPDLGRGADPCFTCFTATVTDNVLNVINNADEAVNVIVRNLLTWDVELSAQVATELDELLPAGLYKLEIYPQTYTPMEGLFEVRE